VVSNINAKCLRSLHLVDSNGLLHFRYVLDNVGEVPLPRWQIVNKLACFEALAVKELLALSLPSFAEGDLIARNMVERLGKCIVTDRKSAERKRTKQPYTVLLLPPSSTVTYAVEYLKFVKGTESELLRKWVGKSSGTNKTLTFEDFLGLIENQIGDGQNSKDADRLILRPLMSGASISSRGLSYIEQLAATEKEISGDHFMVGFLDQVNETLSLLEYEIGYELDEEDFSALGDWMQHEWVQIHKVLLTLSSRSKRILESRSPLDTRLLNTMRKHFEIRTRRFEDWTSSSTKPPPYRSRVS
jgi:hypothetical protein